MPDAFFAGAAFAGTVFAEAFLTGFGGGATGLRVAAGADFFAAGADAEGLLVAFFALAEVSGAALPDAVVLAGGAFTGICFPLAADGAGAAKVF